MGISALTQKEFKLICLLSPTSVHIQTFESKHRQKMFRNISHFSNNFTITKTISLGIIGEPIHFLEDVIVINQNFPRSAMNIVMFLMTITMVTIVNTIGLLWMKVKDRVLIDKMVSLDCVANIMMVGLLLLAFPCRIWSNRFLCGVITFFRAFTVTINR